MKRLYLIVLSVSLFLASCSRDEVGEDSKSANQFESQVPLIWNKLFLEIERYTPGYRPPVSARTIGYINFAAYEAIVNGSNGKYKSFSAIYPDLKLPKPQKDTEYDWEVALHSAYERSFELFFPTAPSREQFQMLQIGSDLRDKLQLKTTPEVFRRSIEFGLEVAQAVYNWSEIDFWGHKAYLKNNDANYAPPTGEFLWKPTYPDFALALLPHWGKVRTFSNTSNVWAPVPPPISADHDSEFYKQTKEVWEMVTTIKQGGLHNERWIAEFWSDDCPILTFTPAARWISVTNQVLSIEGMNMMETVVVYAKVSLALSDAGVRCWAEKFKYNYFRPIDAIRTMMDDPNWNTIMCPDGSGAYFTPPFPAYPSGHATFGAAAAAVLADQFGDNYSFTDRSHEGRTEFLGKPRTFQSFTQMAEENGYSRIPLGVHYRFDAEGGYDLGERVAQKVMDLPWK